MLCCSTWAGVYSLCCALCFQSTIPPPIISSSSASMALSTLPSTSSRQAVGCPAARQGVKGRWGRGVGRDARPQITPSGLFAYDADRSLPPAAFAPAKPAVRAVIVRASQEQQAAASTTSPDALSRRTLLGAGLAVAGASSLPLALPSPAAANQVLSADWEQVGGPQQRGGWRSACACACTGVYRGHLSYTCLLHRCTAGDAPSGPWSGAAGHWLCGRPAR